MKWPRIIPVVDLLGGVVVQAIAGERQSYQPIRSKITSSCEPIEVCQALFAAAHTRELYLADLDAILGRGNQWPQIAALAPLCERLWCDVGFRDVASFAAWQSLPTLLPIFATETLADPTGFSAMTTDYAISLDLREGETVCGWSDSQPDIRDLLQLFIRQEARRFILLDVRSVGRNAGPRWLELCAEVKQRWPEVELITGGGVRDAKDVEALARCGVDGVLIASALHQGVSFKPLARPY